MGHYRSEMCCQKCGNIDCVGECEDKKTPIEQLESGPWPMFIKSLNDVEKTGFAGNAVLQMCGIGCKSRDVSDFDKLRILLESFGVGFDYFNDIDNGLILRCLSGDKKITGVGGSFTQFDFDEDGKFVQMGAW